MAVILGESTRSSPDNMELIERALFGPDEADDIFSTARSALALSSAAATIAGISRSRPWNQDRRRSNNIDSIEASVLTAHQILDRLEAEHRRRKKEKYRLSRRLRRGVVSLKKVTISRRKIPFTLHVFTGLRQADTFIKLSYLQNSAL